MKSDNSQDKLEQDPWFCFRGVCMIEEYVDSMQILDLLVNSENLGIQWCYSLYSVIVCTIVMIYTEEDVIDYCTMIPCSDKQELHSIKVSAGMCLKQCNDDAIRELSWESARGWGWVCSNNATHWLLSINHCSTAACSLVIITQTAVSPSSLTWIIPTEATSLSCCCRSKNWPKLWEHPLIVFSTSQHSLHRADLCQ